MPASDAYVNAVGLNLSALGHPAPPQPPPPPPAIQNDPSAIVSPQQAAPVATTNPMAAGLNLQGIGVAPMAPPRPPPGASAGAAAGAALASPPQQGGPPIVGAVPAFGDGRPPVPPMGALDGDVRMVSGGGTIPAHEVARMSPEQRAAYERAFGVQKAAEVTSAARVEEHAAKEAAVAVSQAEEAKRMADELAVSKIKRDQEAEARIADMDATVKEIAQMSVDPNRFYNNASTGQKLGMVLGMSLGGFVSGASGRPNEALSLINNAIDRDIKAQEFALQAGLKKFDAQKSAYASLMDKYQNSDAARSMMKASMLDVQAAQARELGANAKTVDAMNARDKLIAGLDMAAAKERERAYAYVQASSSGPMYKVTRMGVPVLMSQKEFNAYATDQEKMQHETRDKTLGIMGDLAKEQAKGGGERDKGAEHISDKMQAAGIPALESAVGGAIKDLNKAPITFGERVFKNLPLGGSKQVQSTVLGDAVVQRDQSLQHIKNVVKKEIAGAAMSPEEKKDLVAELEGAGNQAGVMKALENIQNSIDAQKRTILASQPPEAQRTYLERAGSAAGINATPSSFKVAK